MMINSNNKEKMLKLASAIRKKEREELLASRREWIQVPSPVFQLPYRIDSNQWENFEVLLDSLTEEDAELIDLPFRDYLLKQWEQLSARSWESESTINLIRVLFRLRIANKSHLKSILHLTNQASEASKESDEAKIVILKLLKEITINMESSSCSIDEKNDLWEEEALEYLNSLLASLQVWRHIIARTSMRETADYRVFYLVLLADPRVKLQQFVQKNNVQELYLLLNECIDSSDCFQTTKAIQLITKILKIKGDQQVERCLKGVEVLLVYGVNAALRFLDEKPFDSTQQSSFFKRLLAAMGKLDTIALQSGIELIALLFGLFEECIPAAFKVHIPPIQHNDPEGVQVMRPPHFCNFNDLIFSFTQSLVGEVRRKTYWLISNITGSAIHYRKYGLQFITHIYLGDFAILERDNQPIANQIAFCVLNYLCNISSHQEVAELIEIVHKEDKGGRQMNCFLFCLAVASDILDRICVTADFQSHILQEDTFVDEIHRTTFALFMVLQHSATYTDTALDHLQRERVEINLERLQNSLQKREQLCDLIGSVLCAFSTRVKSL